MKNYYIKQRISIVLMGLFFGCGIVGTAYNTGYDLLIISTVIITLVCFLVLTGYHVLVDENFVKEKFSG